jgi:hypothetical protein
MHSNCQTFAKLLTHVPTVGQIPNSPMASAAAESSDEKENKAASFVVDFGETDGGPAKSTLQDRFAQYRKDKAKAFRLRAGSKRTSRTPEELAALRKRFVDRCHHYMGVVSLAALNRTCLSGYTHKA